MSKTTLILTVIYFLLVEAVIFLHSPRAGDIFLRGYKPPEAAPVISLPEEKGFSEYRGEEIVYDVKMGAMKIGTSLFRHEDAAEFQGRAVERVVFQTKVVQVEDTEIIFADPVTFLPVKVERDISMWPKREKITEIYDQKKHGLLITKAGGSAEPPVRIEKSSPIHNAILLPYQVRGVAGLGPGWSMDVVLPTREFKITLLRTEKVSVPAGIFEAFYFESEPKRFAIWISADDRRIPVKIRGSSGVNYTMLMRSYGKK